VDLAGRMMERYPESPDPLAEPAVVLLEAIREGPANWPKALKIKALRRPAVIPP
jgi:hypothetical protein